MQIGTVWESLGLPYKEQIKKEPKTTNQPIDPPKRAYNKIWNDWYRDQNLQRPVHLQNDNLLRINWARDRFTSAGYEQQKGVAPVISSLGNMQIVPKHSYPISVGLENSYGMNIHASIPSGSGLRNIQTSDASNTASQDVRWGIDSYNMVS